MARALVAGLEEQRAATLYQLSLVPDDGWTAPCLPLWRVRDVVAHLLAVDEAIASGRILLVLRRGDRAGIERWNDAAVLRLADVEVDELTERLARRGAQVRAIVRRLPPLLDRTRWPSQYGRLPLRALLSLRVADEWVHAADIAAATGVPAPLRPAAARAIADGVLAMLPAAVLPRVRRPVGVLRLRVVLDDLPTGEPGTGSELRRWGVDFARRQYGPRVRLEPDATVRVHASTLALLAFGRTTWREAPAGAVQVEGDPEVAAGLLDVLRP